MLRQRRPTSTVTPSEATTANIVNATKKDEKSPSSTIMVTHLYSIIWCSCIFLPFFDTMLLEYTKEEDVASKMKFVGAVDHRPLVAWDLYLLFPLNGFILFLYMTWKWWSSTKSSTISSHRYVLRLVYIAHVIDLIIRWIRMPYVWDHEQWAVLCNAMFIACFTHPLFLSRNLSSALIQYWLDQSGYVLGILYLSAAFWKLTSGFWNVPTSCGSSLVLETVVTYWLPKASVPYEVAHLAATVGPHLTLVVEGGLAVAMIYLGWSSKKSTPIRVIVRNITVLSAAFFHLIIYMLPVNAAGGFSLDCLTRLVFFFSPVEVYTVFFETKQYMTISRPRIWMIMTFIWTRYKGTGYLPDVGFVVYCLIFDLYVVIMFRRETKTDGRGGRADNSSISKVSLVTSIPANIVVLFSIVYGFGLTILGVEQMGAPTMYSNLRSYYGGNHLLVPTGILGDHILYGGGLAQVVYSTCDPLNRMLGYINSSDLVPEHLYSYQKSLLRNHTIPFSPVHSDTIPMQFLPLCIGNPHSGKLLIDYYRRSNPIGAPAPFQFILPISAVKKAIRLALANGESFIVKLADAGSTLSKKVPIIEEETAQLVVLDDRGTCAVEHPSSNDESVHDLTECTSNLFAQLLLREDNEPFSWKRYLINKFLIPYPQIVGEPEEICMS